MISNEQSSLNVPGSQHWASKPPVQEDTLRTEHVSIERKTFVYALKENPRGRFQRITEGVGGRHDSIIIPALSLPALKPTLEKLLNASIESLPAGTNHENHNS